MQSSDILTRLRHATASRHAVLDQAMPLADPAATLEHYRDHLVLLRRWLAPVQSWQAGFSDGPQGCPLLPDLAHIPLIDADLGDAAMPAATSAGVPVLAAELWPASASASYRWGISYVIEGSRLGGQVLRRRLAARLAPHPLRYLGDDSSGERWLQFIRQLRQSVTQEKAIEEACSGACDAFDNLIALLPGNIPSCPR